MKFTQTLLATALLFAACGGAQADVLGTEGGGSGTFLTLSSAGLDGGSVATLNGGSLYTSDQPFADIPKGGVFGDTFLAAGRIAGAPATLTFTSGVSFVSFLWGSPDTYNVLTVTGTGGYSHTFTTAELGLPGDGNQGISDYVQFTGTDGTLITSLSFDNDPTNDAFESANFSVTPVPEPQTYALLLAGLVAGGFMTRRRRS
jgi:PEP-CTERM motif